MILFINLFTNISNFPFFYLFNIQIIFKCKWWLKWFTFLELLIDLVEFIKSTAGIVSDMQHLTKELLTIMMNTSKFSEKYILIYSTRKYVNHNWDALSIRMCIFPFKYPVEITSAFTLKLTIVCDCPDLHKNIQELCT